MFNFEFKWWEIILLIIYIIVANIICFPIFLLQRMKIKCKKVANWLCDKGFDELTFYDIYFFKDEEKRDQTNK